MMTIHVCSLNEEIAREVARHMTPVYVAAARRLVLLRKLEWSATTGEGVAGDPVRACCPWCHQDEEAGHAEECKLAEELTRREG
jgi:hypothetical protein